VLILNQHVKIVDWVFVHSSECTSWFLLLGNWGYGSRSGICVFLLEILKLCILFQLNESLRLRLLTQYLTLHLLLPIFQSFSSLRKHVLLRLVERSFRSFLLLLFKRLIINNIATYICFICETW
jgi:hypothetical protein